MIAALSKSIYLYLHHQNALRQVYCKSIWLYIEKQQNIKQNHHLKKL